MAAKAITLAPVLRLEHLAELIQTHGDLARVPVRGFPIGSRHFDWENETALMGVVNLSPGSWYRESVCLTAEAAVRRARILHAQGAAIVDLGAESSLAHTDRVDADAQCRALLPIVRELAGAGIPISVETYHAGVTRLALEAGAMVINLTGMVEAGEIYDLAARHDAAVIICFVQGDHVRATEERQLAADPIPVLREYFAREIARATAAGASRLILDPGLGFYYRNLQDGEVRVRHQINTFLNSFRLRELGWPVCHALPHAFEYFGDEVRSAEGFFAVLAALGGAHLFRTHEVPRVKAVLDTLRVARI